VEVSDALTAANHFAHRETDDIVVDLFWSRRAGDEFRVEVEDRREHVRFLLCGGGQGDVSDGPEMPTAGPTLEERLDFPDAVQAATTFGTSAQRGAREER
jgi:hypothetical protein